MSELEFTDLDKAILARLTDDARKSNRELARELGVAEGTIRLRLKRLFEHNAIEVLAISNIDESEAGLIAYLWITVDAEFPIKQILDDLVAQPQITYVTTLIGRADILAITWVEDAAQLADFLHVSIDRIPGVSNVRYELAHKLIKHDYMVTHIV